MSEITLRDIYQSQQELLGSFKEMQTEQKSIKTDQSEMRGSLKELQIEQREMHGSLKELQIEQREMRGSLQELQVEQRETRKSISDLKEAQQETLEALNAFASHVDGKFSEIDAQFTEIRATMVTKDYLDNKIADLRGDLVLLARKGNTKLSTLIERLVEEKRLDPKVAHQILLMEPFPQA